MLNVGVIGCGGMGRDHIKRLTERTQGAKVVAVADMVDELAKKGAAVAGVDCKIYKDAIDLINDPEVNAVFIITPGFAHKAALLLAIKAGKRIFCEKPLCTTAEDCLEVIDAEVKSGKHLIQLGFMRRYDKGYLQVKEAIKSGHYGEPLMVHCTHRNPEVGTNYDTPMAVHDTAIHEIDVIHWLVGDDFVSAQVLMPRVTKYSHSKLQDPQIMLLRTKNGICVDNEVFVNCKFGYDINCEVVCEDGAIKMPNPAYPSIRKNAAAATTIDTDCFVRFHDAYDAEVQSWVNDAEKNIIGGPTTWDGYLAAITADALVRAQTSGAIEKIKPAIEKPGFYK
ncbi:myo-inositol 2-dehydrogenase / D-chiro-inositol 1-dehydrogenase [Propionispira arboris]|uniref:Inositol 2-dehydrogenase/D-chiro-inositol 3-dehydrogenase n=1 Tax=Propionispira arboris TaxID=84035 RepID=A0A1H6TK92_9FIRM|nr:MULTISPECIES: Gfo/Idh/MocA family oxidoreductase [Propionispira]SEI78594.1 myo-inositol 2-dehydrogenase / D-chiro-inositol 1-dehydrogenase [Propionispira arboris]